MPALTDSFSELTIFAKWLSIGLLAITYPKLHSTAASSRPGEVCGGPEKSSGNQRNVGFRRRPTRCWSPGRLQIRNSVTRLSVVETYREPAVLWRLRHTNGDRARATLIPGSPASTLVFLVNDRLDRGENFEEWADALARAEQVRAELVEKGWTVD